jgi:hypothetical protein
MAGESFEEQAEALLLHIECISLYATRRINTVLRQIISQVEFDIPEYDFQEIAAQFSDPNVRLSIHEIESSAGQLSDLVPADPHLRATLAQLLSRKYRFTRHDITALGQLLGLDTEAVNEAHRSLFRSPIDAIYAAKSPPDPRPFWLRFPGNVLQEIMPDFAREVE